VKAAPRQSYPVQNLWMTKWLQTWLEMKRGLPLPEPRRPLRAHAALSSSTVGALQCQTNPLRWSIGKRLQRNQMPRAWDHQEQLPPVLKQPAQHRVATAAVLLV